MKTASRTNLKKRKSPFKKHGAKKSTPTQEDPNPVVASPWCDLTNMAECKQIRQLYSVIPCISTGQNVPNINYSVLQFHLYEIRAK